jgi:hypothetical protein
MTVASRTGSRTAEEPVAPGELARRIEEYLSEHPTAAVLEDGRVVFDMRTARYSATESHGRCLLQLWSEERNVMRTVVGVEARAQHLRIATRKMGAPKPQLMEFAPTGDRRTPSARDTTRRNYQKLLERVLAREFIGHKIDGMRSAMDLEHSFGPAYTRGRLVKGTAADAVIGVNAAEPGATVDGVLTLGILWLEYCRQKTEARRHVGGLKVVVPAGAWRTTAERMVWLNAAAADFQLFTLDERSEELAPVDFHDVGNVESRLVHAFRSEVAIERCRDGLDRLLALVPEGAQARVETLARSATEVGLLLHGLEFARVRQFAAGSSFVREMEVTFGAGAHETPLTGETEPMCRELFARLFESRHPEGTYRDALFRLQPERWLESRLRREMGTMLAGLRAEPIYCQVPALASGERGMLDLLALDRAGRLTVIELKASEDLHLPMQALDYWIRVRALNEDRKAGAGVRNGSAFERAGYFPDAEVSMLAPRLLLIAPTLRTHPANQPVLRYLSPQIEWELIGVGEDWRRDLKVVSRARRTEKGQ